MTNRTSNPSIKCTVSQCAFHCPDTNYCSLDEIKVSRCAAQVTSSAGTECASFTCRPDCKKGLFGK